jgi:hypothetical protein
MIRRIFSMLAIAFLAMTTLLALPGNARAEAWFQSDTANPSFQEQYSQENTYSPNNDQALQDNQYAQNSGQNSPNNDQTEQQSASFTNNQSNQGKGQNQSQSPRNSAQK